MISLAECSKRTAETLRNAEQSYYPTTGITWREIDSHRISNDATILSARDYAARWPGLKLPGYALAA
jgi:hypothetical protein